MAHVTVQDVLREGFASYRQKRKLPEYVVQAARRMMQCRTSALGGHVESCPCGHVQRIWYNSCKHRSCPQCAYLDVEKWLARQKERLLACDHYHTVFTVPAELNVVWQYNRWLFAHLMFLAVRDTLCEFLEDPQHLGARPGMIMALHTWASNLTDHPHIHCLVTGGGLAEDGSWKRVRRQCFLPRKPLMLVFRGKLRAALLRALKRGELQVPPRMRRSQLRGLLNKLGRQVWNVKILECHAAGQGVLTYLARYLRGGPISNRRILRSDEGKVTFLYKDSRDLDAKGRPRKKQMRLAVETFIHRLLQHVPPPHMQTVRSYGLYANNQSPLLDQAREALGQCRVPAPRQLLVEDVLKDWGCRDPEPCPICGQPPVVRTILEPARASPALKTA